MIIAIDGPSGAGKSSVSKLVAIELGFSCLDTGAMYRSVAWQALHEGVSLDDDEALAELARTRAIEFVHEPGNPSPVGVFIDGKVLEPAEYAELLDLPSRDALYSRVLGTMLAPITSLAVVLGQVLEQKGGSVETAEAAE